MAGEIKSLTSTLDDLLAPIVQEAMFVDDPNREKVELEDVKAWLCVSESGSASGPVQ